MELRLSQRHVTALNFLLIAGIAYFAARSVNQIISRNLATTPAPPAAAAGPRETFGARPRTDYDTIVKRDIFNLVPQEQPEAAVTALDLHLKLLGTSSTTRDKPYAIIEDQTGNQTLYKVGEDVPGAGKLVRVERARAIIDHDGQRVALEIPEGDIPARENQMPRFPGRRGMPLGLGAFKQDRPPPAPDPDPDSVDVDVEETGTNRYALKRDEVANAVKHSAELMTQIRAMPNISHGTSNGLTLSDIEAGSVFEDLGLEDGDVLTAIDGRPLQNPVEALGLMNTLPNRPSVDLTVVREGHPVQLHYDIR
ncbi:MAG TPA: type II secretion system protein GspC [Candidatus Binataceae bacterium]|nr:type II secretion system protein GspC [Candidatus Binataceae bacterium]